MSKQLNFIGQQALDLFYQNYKSDVDFFDVDDATSYAGNAVASIYQKLFDLKRAEIRAEKKDEIVTFDVGVLSQQILNVIKSGNSYKAAFTSPIMSFFTDSNTSGIQEVIVTSPVGVEVERTSISQLWQQKFMPATNVIFWYSDSISINFIVKGNCNVNTVVVYYVPAVNDTMLVPDGIVEDAIKETLQLMMAAKNGVVIKKSIDGNQNKIMETEIDKSQLK
jgi:hypothetical protein